MMIITKIGNLPDILKKMRTTSLSGQLYATFQENTTTERFWKNTDMFLIQSNT